MSAAIDFTPEFRQIDVEIAAYLVVRSQFGSTSMFQRFMRIGFAKAVAIMAELERLGFVGPSIDGGSRARDVLIPVDRMTEIVSIIRDWPEPS